MKCSQCSHCDSSVIDSREAEDGGSIRRRRECPNCKHRFTTYERLEAPRLMVVKKDGGRELFDRAKLSVGIYKAFHKRPLSASGIEKFIDDLEREIYEESRDEISSSEIGEMVMRKLESVDQVAYIRFAAVYREFTDLAAFSAEITKVIHRGEERLVSG
jgi:transcriptional repressor NrdR